MADACLGAETHIFKFVCVCIGQHLLGALIDSRKVNESFLFRTFHMFAFVHLINTDTPCVLLSFNEPTKLLAVIRVRAPIIALPSRMSNTILIVTLMIVLLTALVSFSWLANEKSNRNVDWSMFSVNLSVMLNNVNAEIIGPPYPLHPSHKDAVLSYEMWMRPVFR